MKKAFEIVCAAVVVMGLCASVIADDILPPSWRGGPLTTMQQWQFTTPGGLGAPDAGNTNPYGDMQVSVTGDATWEPTSSSSDAARSNAWRLLDDPSGGTTSIHCDGDDKNTPVTFIFGSFEEGKQDVVQITFSGDTPVLSVLPIPGKVDFSTSLDSSSITTLGDGWKVLTQRHTYYGLSNPSGENFVISVPDGGATWIDHVVIDTQTLPEPATLSLLAIGGLAVLRKRRR